MAAKPNANGTILYEGRWSRSCAGHDYVHPNKMKLTLEIIYMTTKAYATSLLTSVRNPSEIRIWDCNPHEDWINPICVLMPCS